MELRTVAGVDGVVTISGKTCCRDSKQALPVSSKILMHRAFLSKLLSRGKNVKNVSVWIANFFHTSSMNCEANVNLWPQVCTSKIIWE